ncbi:hypothetical protein PRVXH_002552 [Proteinivorax hydrogeniformans]|uniref:Energy-coupling factor transport system substrate-specific component n=1 Tax=Proteinivorax hydrogeniformans TaxID=1826727 RepID=A0AAU8HT84_9FIRM
MHKKIITLLVLTLLNIMSYFVIYQRDDVYSTVLVATVTFVCIYWGKGLSLLTAAIPVLFIYRGDLLYTAVLLASLAIYLFVFDYFLKLAYKKETNKSLLKFSVYGISLGVLARITFFGAVVYRWSIEVIAIAVMIDIIGGIVGLFATSFASFYYKDWFAE